MGNISVSVLKDHLPDPVMGVARAIFNGYPSLLAASMRQAVRFGKSYSRNKIKYVEQAEAHIIYCTHQLEKGLSHEGFRAGFGVKVLAELSRYMHVFEDMGGSTDSLVYQSALGALIEYRDRHKYSSEYTHMFKQAIGDQLFSKLDSKPLYPGGSCKIAHDFAGAGIIPGSVDELLSNRHSVREYSDTPVSLTKVINAIETATKAPSACNRQPTRVRIINNQELINKTLGITSGFRGYAMPPMLVVLTVDNRVYFGPQERNEGFVDGGIFAMALLLALEEQGLASCPLNTMLRQGPEKAIRGLLKLPYWEELIMLISIGNYSKNAQSCVSTRFHADAIVTVVD